MGMWRLAKQRNIMFVDITAKTGISAFAPLFGNVMQYKQGKLSEDLYTELYVAKMRESVQLYHLVWKTLQEPPDGSIAVACYCPADHFCHRLLFRDMAKKYLEYHGFEVTLMGELTKENK